ncbi:hypothetical protein GCM10009558_084270 [Virgisporangium aurantiacum]
MTGNVDDLLRGAGERWRSTQPPPPQPDPGRWAPVPATTSATLVAVAAVAVLTTRTRDTGDEDRTGNVSTATAQSPPDLVVRDGMRVRASGTVLAVPGQPVRFCAPATSTAPAGADLPACVHGVVVTGVDLGALAQPVERAGARIGSATLTGTLRSGVLAVTGQAPPEPAATAGSPAVPCPAPAGGWTATGPFDGRAVQTYVAENADRFRNPWVGRADGGAEVLVVEVVRGDAGAARTDLRRRYSGNLCVVSSPGRLSLAEQAATLDRVQPVVLDLLRDPATGVYALGGAENVIVAMVVLTPDLYDRLAAIGLTADDLSPWLRPVR